MITSAGCGNQSDQTLMRACTYQRDDVLALGLVWQWMVENQRLADAFKLKRFSEGTCVTIAILR